MTSQNNINKDNKDSEKAYTFFCVINNPKDITGDKPDEDIPKELIDMWIEDDPDNHSGAVNLEVGDSGTIHSHLVLSSKKQTRFSKLKSIYGKKIHIETMKGRKEDAKDYITKTGRFAEKSHTIIVQPYFCGDIVSNRGHRTDLQWIKQLIDDGLNPKEIFAENFSFRRYDKMIGSAYYEKRIEEIPTLRDVKVVWHTGETETGKTYEYIKLCEKYGQENVFLYCDFKSGGFDHYDYEPILFIDELRDQIPYPELLRLLDKYTYDLHARYQNKRANFNEIHIASILSPKEVYDLLIPPHRRVKEPYSQLERRIHQVIEHYVEDNQYKQRAINAGSFPSKTY